MPWNVLYICSMSMFSQCADATLVADHHSYYRCLILRLFSALTGHLAPVTRISDKHVTNAARQSASLNSSLYVANNPGGRSLIGGTKLIYPNIRPDGEAIHTQPECKTVVKSLSRFR